jgi:phosphatidylglycerophosphatase C
MNLALFDFDGTITCKDSMFDFILFSNVKTTIITGLLILFPVLILYKLKIISNWKAKELVLSYFYKDWSLNSFNEVAFEYSKIRIPFILRRNAIDRLNYHVSQKDKIVIVSASVETWLEGWCTQNGFDLIGTKMETIGGRITGKLLARNCNGVEKVNRIKEKYSLKDYKKIYAYGDSKGDIPMLGLADEKYFKWNRMND